MSFEGFRLKPDLPDKETAAPPEKFLTALVLCLGVVPETLFRFSVTLNIFFFKLSAINLFPKKIVKMAFKDRNG